MKASLSSAGLVALVYHTTISFASALPSDFASRSEKKSFVFDVHRDWEAARTSMKFALPSFSSPDDLIEQTTPADWGYYWFMNITAGGYEVNVLMDTGSADLWLLTPHSGPDSIDGIMTWDPERASNTWKMEGEHFNLGYGTGGNGVSGDVYATEVCVGEACTYMAVGEASHCQGLGGTRSGIMGFAFKGGNSIRPEQQQTYMESLLPQLDEPIFVTKFAAEGGDSQIALGSNPFDFQPPLQHLTAQSGASDQYPYSWSYSGVQYFKENEYLGTFNVVFDTGGPSTSARIDIVRKYYDGIPGARDVNGDGSSWTVPCGTPLPDLYMNFGEAFVIIPGFRFYNGNPATSGDCDVWFVKENSPDRAVIGNPFFAQHVVIFNQEDSTIHWGNQI